MNAVALAEKLFTVDEYIAFEEQSDVRHEFHYGRLVPMAVGTSKKHNGVKQNIVYALRGPRLEELAQRLPALALELLRAAGSVMATRMRANLAKQTPFS